ncbi:hypothetical protein L6R46_02030 [Myxococcota bacterium]|jgi:hypothetical protein|nr:hypothetical protein [Myxococcota bacterium]
MDVNWRLFMAGASLFLGIGVNGYLLSVEDISGVEQGSKQLIRAEDPLRISYVAAERENNMKTFGLDDAKAKQASKKVQDLQDDYGERLTVLLREAGDPNQLADALCGETQDVRPRYGALRYIINEEKGRRQVVNLRRVSGIEAQDWYLLSSVGEVYREAELLDDRQPDATVMAIAAILLAKESELLDHNAPWGRGIALQWSWDKVKKENAGVEERVIEYLATMHLLVELAQAEGGLCDG